MTGQVYTGIRAKRKLGSGDRPSANDLHGLREAVQVGEQMKVKVLSYVETLISVWNEREDFESVDSVVPNPFPASKSLLSDLNDKNAVKEALVALSNCVKRHVCRPYEYCRSA